MVYNGHTSTLAQLAKACEGLNLVTLVTATNAGKAKEEWLTEAKKDRLTNPVFTYSPVVEKVAAGQEALDYLIADFIKHIQPNGGFSLHPYSAPRALHHLLDERIQEAQASSRLATGIYAKDPELMTKAAQAIFGVPNEATVKAAHQAAANLRRDGIAQAGEENSALAAPHIARHFETLILKLGTPDWRCLVEDNCTAIDVRDQDSAVHIPTKRKVTSHKLKKLSGHEINNHLRASANARAIIGDWVGGPKDPLFVLVNWLAKSADECLYEGVAKASDVHLELTYGPPHHGTNPELPAPWYTLALSYALAGHDFRETADYLIGELTTAGYSEQTALTKAWTFCYRIFRGSTDTSAKGCCFTKDYAYFAGYSLFMDPANHALVPVMRDYSSLGLNFIREFAPLLAEHEVPYPALPDGDL